MRCIKCGEPWDNDCLHEEISERIRLGTMTCRRDGKHKSGNPRYDQFQYGKLYDQIRQEFYRNGCEVLTSFGAKCSNNKAEPILKEYVGVAYALLGDDADGIDAILEEVTDW